MSAELRIARGSLHVGRALIDRHFAGLQTVVLLRDDEDLVVVPMRDADAGGLLLKVRNAAGDRVVDAADFLRGQGIADDLDLRPGWTWDSERAALVVPRIFPAVRKAAGRSLRVIT